MRRPLALMLLLSMSVLMPSVAGAHGGATSGTNYESNVLTTPAGIAARMVGGDDRLMITRTTPATVIVLGYNGEPYLRLDLRGVWQNERSPAVALNDVRIPPTTDVGIDTPKGEPRWVQTGSGNEVVFHDHRSHWMSSKPPAVVRADPSQPRTLYDWSIPVTVAGQSQTITGDVAWLGAPRAWLWWLITVVAAIGALVIGLKAPLPAFASAVVAMLLTIVAGAATGISLQLDLPDSTTGVVVAAAIALLLMAVGLGFAVLTRRTPAHAVTVLLLASMIAGGVQLIGVAGPAFGYALVPGPLPTLATRLFIIVGIASLALLVGLTIRAWQGLLQPAQPTRDVAW